MLKGYAQVYELRRRGSDAHSRGAAPRGSSGAEPALPLVAPQRTPARLRRRFRHIGNDLALYALAYLLGLRPLA